MIPKTRNSARAPLNTLRAREQRRQVILSALNGSLKKVRREYPYVKGAYTYGSFASGVARPRDLDVMLIIDGPAMMDAEKPHIANVDIRSKHASLHLAKRVLSAQDMLSDLVKARTGLEVGVNVKKGGKVMNFGMMFFDLSKPEAALGSLSVIRDHLRGVQRPGRRKASPPFELQSRHFVGTNREIVRHFTDQWAKLKAE